MLKCGLLPLSQHANLFYGKVGYHASEGFALDLEERKRLARDLGDNMVMILHNHGTLVVGHTVAEAFSAMWHLERAMQAQVDAMACGQDLTQVSHEIAEQTAQLAFTRGALRAYDGNRSPLGWMEWPALLRMLDRMDPSYRN